MFFSFSYIKPLKDRLVPKTMKVITTFILITIFCCFLAVFLASCEEIEEDEWLSIEQFHRKLDKDEDGTVRQSEILSDVNEYNSLQETKIEVNLDETPLSLRNLMQQWTLNPVRSWTPRQVAHWARVTVKMPEILTQIHDKKISGTVLPILAVDRDQILRIFSGLDNKHADKLMLYAFKLVISGPSDNELPSLYDDSNKDWVAFEQIVVFFKEMDKDDDGCVDMDEADGERDGPVLSTSTPCDEISIEHRTLSEVWDYWSRLNPVRNWTVDEVSAWLEQERLGKYIETFAKHKVVGLHLPKIAANAKTFYLRELNVNKEDRKKLMISAISLVLFGPSKVVTQSNLLADVLFAIFCVAIATGAIWYGYNQRKLKMEFEGKFVESEQSLEQIKEQMNLLNEIEKSIDIELVEVPTVQETESVTLIEIQQEDSSRVIVKYETPEELISLLRCTYLREYEFYDLKKLDIEQLIDKARRQHENLKRKHGNILSALFISNTRVLDNNEVLMVDTKSRLDRLTQDMQELSQRWQKIESLTQSSLMQHSSTRRAQSQHSLLSYNSQTTLDSIGAFESEYISTEIVPDNVGIDSIDSLKDPRETEINRSTSCPRLNANVSTANGENESGERRKKSSIRKTFTKPIKKYITDKQTHNGAEGDIK